MSAAHRPGGPGDRYYGKYEGVVTDVDDPKKVGRLRAQVPALLGEKVETGWALPCVPFGGGPDRGMFFLPSVGDTVWIEFAAGDLLRPIWAGTFWGAPDSAGGADDLAEKAGAETPTSDGTQAKAQLSILRTASGHRLVLDDEGEIVLLAAGNGKASITFTRDGEVVVTAEKITLGASGTEKAVLGDTFKTLFNQHTHPTGVGPSGPPSQAMGSSHLSSTVRAK